MVVDPTWPTIKTELPPEPPQKPCSWCKNESRASMLCQCKRFCGRVDCPNNPEADATKQPVPRFR